MRTNKKPLKRTTHEGGIASRITVHQELERTLMACLLFENSFYEDGESIADRLRRLVAQAQPEFCMQLAIRARTEGQLRHAPLLIMRELARHKSKPKIADTLCAVVQRADELTEFLALYWADGKQPLSKQVKTGLAQAFLKFDECQLAKYDRANAVRLRDVMFMVRPKPQTDAQAALFKKLADGTLATPDTWEVALSGGADKQKTWMRLLESKKLGYMALLRNLRNMLEVGVPVKTLSTALVDGAAKSRALPFRYIAAARHAVALEPALDEAMQAAMAQMPKLSGDTIVLVDVSGSMDDKLSSKSELTRLDAACGVAILLRGICESVRVYTFSNQVKEVPARRGMALKDAIVNSQPHGGTWMGRAVSELPRTQRLVVITDEQSHDTVGAFKADQTYVMNVASYQNGVSYGNSVHISGFSEALVKFIGAYESDR